MLKYSALLTAPIAIFIPCFIFSSHIHKIKMPSETILRAKLREHQLGNFMHHTDIIFHLADLVLSPHEVTVNIDYELIYYARCQHSRLPTRQELYFHRSLITRAVLEDFPEELTLLEQQRLILK